MHRALKPHPNSPCFAAVHVEVDLARAGSSGLIFHYCVTGNIGDLRLPDLVAPARANGLWQHTCFEAFVGTSTGAAYYEFNFSPSTQWAAYQFDDYRSGMRVATEIDVSIDVHSEPKSYMLKASLELDRLSNLPRDSKWRLGLSALIEEACGRQSYWALAHPAGKADFHNSDCFIYEFFPT
jgi:hypothetical protein